MEIERSIALKLLGSLGLAGLLLLSMGPSLGLAQGPFTKTRVTFSSDGDNRFSVGPSLSADGTKVAFTSDSDFLGQGILDNQTEIWLFDTTTMTLTRVTTSSDGTNIFTNGPNLSPDGTKVAFHSNGDFLGQGISQNHLEIWLFDTATMTLTRVTTSGSGRESVVPSLNEDGTKVAFESTADFLGQGIDQFQPEIWLYDIPNMILTRVTTSSDGTNRFSIEPRLSANGTKVAFYSDSDFLGQGILQNQQEIWLYDTTTTTLTGITTSALGFNPANVGHSLSADGTKVAFTSSSDFLGQGIPPDQFEIWLYSTTTMTLTRVTTSSDGANRTSFGPSLSANGTKVAFTSDSDFLGQGIPDDQFEIWLYDTTTMTFTRVTTSSDGVNRSSSGPSLNANGTKVAFVSDSDFLNQGIAQHQWEVWLFEDQAVIVDPPNTIYLPIIFKN